jgi:hypothetical protein
MQRLIMTSSTYRQGSLLTPAVERSDPDNVLLSRMPLKRMDAGELYDSLLMVSGRLDETRYGPPDPVQDRVDGLITPIPTEKGWRRSIYVAQRRSKTPTLLAGFDYPPMGPNCLERFVSTVAPQALHLMNNGMVEGLAKLFAERLVHEVGADPRRQISQAYWIALSRPPSEEEERISLTALDRFRVLAGGKDTRGAAMLRPAAPPDRGATMLVTAHQTVAEISPPGDIRVLAAFCHALLNSAAFLYID